MTRRVIRGPGARRLALWLGLGAGLLGAGLLGGCNKLSGAPRFGVEAKGKKFIFQLSVGPKRLLESDSYASKEAAVEGIKTLQTNGGAVTCNTTHRVVFKAKNHRLLAKSAEPYDTAKACEAAISTVRLAVERADRP